MAFYAENSPQTPKSANFTPAPGAAGQKETPPDLTLVQPVFDLTITGGSVFVFLTMDTTPNYTATQAFPGNRTVWTYRAIYRVDDKPVGVWSQPVSLAVPA